MRKSLVLKSKSFDLQKKLFSIFSLSLICIFSLISCGEDETYPEIIKEFDILSLDQQDEDSNFLSIYCRLKISDPDGSFKKGSIYINNNRLLKPDGSEGAWVEILKQNFPSGEFPDPADLIFSLQMNQKDLENLPADKFHIIIYLRDQSGKKSNTAKAQLKFEERSTEK